jgi:hypothetical protein
METVNACYDNELPFQKFQYKTRVREAAASNDLRIRSAHRLHPKVTRFSPNRLRSCYSFSPQSFGVRLDSTQNIPSLSKEEVYNTCEILCFP